MRKTLLMVLVAGTVAWSAHALADSVEVGPEGNLEKVLTAQRGKKVTVRLGAGEDLTGTVREVTSQLLVLGELTGKEFYDAVISTKNIAAVIIRTK